MFTMQLEYRSEMFIIVRGQNGIINEVMLHGVWYIPRLVTDLLSKDCFTEQGADIRFTRYYTEVYYDEGDKKVSLLIAPKVAQAKCVEYFLQSEIGDMSDHVLSSLFSTGIALPVNVDHAHEAEQLAAPVVSQAEQQGRENNLLCHSLMGHTSAKYLSILPRVSEEMPKIVIKAGEFAECDVCIRAKSAWSSHSQQCYHATRVYQIVCSDILGPLIESERNNEKYVINFIDDSSIYCVIYPIVARSNILWALKGQLRTIIQGSKSRAFAVIMLENM